MITETIPDALADERVDRIVSFITGCSRKAAAALIDEGGVTRNGRLVRKGSEKAAAGDEVSIEEGALPVDTKPTADASVALTVVHEDDHVIVVDKPAGIVVHPGAGAESGTLVHGLLARYPEIATVGEPERPGIVHRLDKGTSGALMVARTELAYESLVGQLQHRTVERRYLAVTVGHIGSDSGVVDARLGRSRRHPTKQAVVAAGREARTHYAVVSRHEQPAPSTVVHCVLETGRTHQIRVHLSAIGHPVVGDETYGGTSGGIDFGRPALHAEVLGFEHPDSGDELRFESAVPADLSDLVASLD